MKLLANFNRTFVLFTAVCSLTLFTTGCESIGGGGGVANLSIEELKAAAADGDANASFKLGEAYFKGNGVDKDFVESQKWYEQAAQQFQTK